MAQHEAHDVRYSMQNDVFGKNLQNGSLGVSGMPLRGTFPRCMSWVRITSFSALKLSFSASRDVMRSTVFEKLTVELREGGRAKKRRRTMSLATAACAIVRRNCVHESENSYNRMRCCMASSMKLIETTVQFDISLQALASKLHQVRQQLRSATTGLEKRHVTPFSTRHTMTPMA